jgi:hypothetical protein
LSKFILKWKLGKSSEKKFASSVIFETLPKRTIAQEAKIRPIWSPCLGRRHEFEIDQLK